MKTRYLWDGPAWLTWLLHAVLAALYTLLAVALLPLVPAWVLPASYAIVYYGVREIEGYLYTQQVLAVDRLMDVLVPAAVALALAWGLR